MRVLSVIALVCLCLAAAPPPRPADEGEIRMDIENLSMVISPKASIEIQQSDGSFRKYATSEHETFYKELQVRSLIIRNLTIRDRRVIRVTFVKKPKKT